MRAARCSPSGAVYGREDPDDADGPVIRLVGDARFSKVAVYRGHYDPWDQAARVVGQ